MKRSQALIKSLVDLARGSSRHYRGSSLLSAKDPLQQKTKHRILSWSGEMVGGRRESRGNLGVNIWPGVTPFSLHLLRSQPAEIVLWCNKHASHTTVSLTEIQGELVVQPCLLMALFSWHGTSSVVVDHKPVMQTQRFDKMS